MFEKGSEWRRWDLHVHTPNTKKNDNYKGDTVEEKWKNFYSAIETYINSTDERKKVSAIGITDYLAIDNYNKVVSDGILVKDELAIFPNVEMRITPMGKKSPVNIHFIFNPDFVDKLENRFFGRLEFEYGRKYHATKSDLIELGKSMGIEDNEEAYKKGIEQFVPSYTAISNLFKDDVELRENTLIGVANNSPNYKFKFEYRSGSIENSTIVYENDGTIRKGVLNEKGIQQHICDILEGGERAFDLRKHKYSI